MATLGLFMLIIPIWILKYVHEAAIKLGVISVFVALFLVFVSFATVAKPSETLGATAAYTAVLMVFLQSSSTN
ncbi:hypothetical protein DL98DRAFT_595852 [Cadophora sp. DSE1049]|nr:hypothetical protein DL98DRAFT_595852 [Cadophora sp. DSE1049]